MHAAFAQPTMARPPLDLAGEWCAIRRESPHYRRTGRRGTDDGRLQDTPATILGNTGIANYRGDVYTPTGAKVSAAPNLFNPGVADLFNGSDPNRPSWGTFAGFEVWNFDKTASQFLTTAATAGLYPAGAALEVWCVAQVTTPAATEVLTSSNGTQIDTQLGHQGAANARMLTIPAIGLTAATTPQTDYVNLVLFFGRCVVPGAPAVAVAVNGGTESTAGPANAGPQGGNPTIAVGRGSTGGGYITAAVAEVCFANGPSAAQRQRLTNYYLQHYRI